jgi:hypothetical protein
LPRWSLVIQTRWWSYTCACQQAHRLN